METFQLESYVRGYHIYQKLWEAVIEEELQCQRQHDNPIDIYTVAVRRGRTVVGHLPLRLSHLCTPLKNFRTFNFRHPGHWQKIFNSENFPIYGMLLLYKRTGLSLATYYKKYRQLCSLFL